MNMPVNAEELVNVVTEGSQNFAAVTALAGGGYVVTWATANADGSGLGIAARLYTDLGEPVGGEIRVNQNATGDQTLPAIAATDDGGFVIAWQSSADSFDSVVARKFDALGVAAADEVVVSDAGLYHDRAPAVAGLPGGGFVVGWASNDSSAAGQYQDVSLRQYNADSTPAGAAFKANVAGVGGSYDTQEDVRLAALAPSAALPAGGYVVTWTDNEARDGSGDSTWARIFDAAGVPQGAEFLVNSFSASDQDDAQVVGLAGGRFVVAWRDTGGADTDGHGVLYRVYEADGTAATGELVAPQSIWDTQNNVAITATADGGFYITWTSLMYDAGAAGYADGYYGRAVYGRAFDVDGVAVDDEALINEATNGDQYSYGVAGLSTGDIAAVYVTGSGDEAGDADSWAVLHRLIGDPAAARAFPGSPLVEAVSTSVATTEAALNAGLVRLDADGAAAVSDPDSGDFDGGRLVLARLVSGDDRDGFVAADHEAQDLFGFVPGGDVTVVGASVRVMGVEVGLLSSDGTGGAPLIVELNAAADAAAVEILVEHLGYGMVTGDPDASVSLQLMIEDGDGGGSDPLRIDIAVTPDEDAAQPSGAELRLNAVTADNQNDVNIAALEDGGWIAAWTAADPYSGSFGVAMRRFDASGVPTTGEASVTPIDAGASDPQPAGLTDGGWIVGWTVGGSIRLARYDVNGVELFTDLQVETTTTGTQNAPRVAGLSNGGYAVAWSSSSGDGSGYGVFVQLYNAAGSAVGGETSVNTQASSDQTVEAILGLDSGRYAVAWTDADSTLADGSGAAVKMRIFDASGAAESGEITLNQTTLGAQTNARLTVLANGDIVAIWTDEYADDQYTGVHMRIFDSSGAAKTDDIRVNDITDGYQYAQSVTALADGGFVVGFRGAGNVDGDPAQTYDSTGVWVQEFNADGSRRDSQALAADYLSGTQEGLTLAGLAGGGYAAAWTTDDSSTGDASGDGLGFRLFGPAVSSAAPTLSALSATTALTEDEAEAGAALLPFGFTVTDADSADFDGGLLRVSARLLADNLGAYEPGDDSAQDQLIIRAVGGVSVAGSTVSVGGVAVADIVSDGADGAPLLLTFLPGASVERVQALVQALGYQNASDAPAGARTYALDISDGDGGWSGSVDVTVNISQVAEADALEAQGPARDISPDAGASQSEAASAELTDGGWVTVYLEDGAVKLRRFTSDGLAATVEEAVTDGTSTAYQPQVTGLSNGGYAVTWRGTGAGGSDTSGVHVMTYDAAGALVSGPVQVNVTEGGTQQHPDLAAIPAAAGGGFWAIWADDAADIMMQRFDASGAPVARGGVGAGYDEVVVPSTGNVYYPAVAVLPTGGIVAVWEEYVAGTSSYDIRVQVYSAAGIPGASFTANQTVTGAQEYPSIAVTQAGGFVIAWNGPGPDGTNGAVARIFDASGAALTDDIFAGDPSVQNGGNAEVAVLADGRIAVGQNQSNDAHIQILSADGRLLDTQVQANEGSNTADAGLGLVAPSGGGLVATWTEAGQIQHRLFGAPGQFYAATAPEVVGFSETASFDEADVQAGFQRLDLDGAVGFADPDASTFDGAAVTLTVEDPGDVDEFAGADGLGQNLLGLVAGDIGAGDVQVSGAAVSVNGVAIGAVTEPGTGGAPFTVTFNAAATREDVEAVLSALGFATGSDAPAATRTLRLDVFDADGHAGASQAIEVTVTPEIDSALEGGAAPIINSDAYSTQYNPVGAEFGAGMIVTAWSSYDPVVGYVARGQFFDGAGNAVGGEFDIDPDATQAAYPLDIVQLAGGGFAVVTLRVTSGQQEIAAQVYDSTGAALGASVLIDDSVIGQAAGARATATADGGFIVAWHNSDGSFDGSSYAVLQRAVSVGGGGATMGTTSVVNALETSGAQYMQDIAAFTDGTSAAGHVVLYRSTDASLQGVYARVYDASGTAVSEFLVNQYEDSNQDDAEVVGLAGGGFVIAWTSAGEDGSVDGVYARIYDAAGTATGDAFRVNTTSLNNQSNPALVALDDGGFIVAWQGWTVGIYDMDIIGQRYDAAGARIDGEFYVNPPSGYANETEAFLFPTAGGAGFGALWREPTYGNGAVASTGDGNGDAVSMRLFAAPAPGDDRPAIVDLVNSLSIDADDAVAGPVILDEAVGVVESAAGVANGALRFYWALRGEALDALSIETGGGVVVSGSDIEVDGVLVGVIDAVENGAAGAALTIAFNGAATAQAVQRIAERLAYSSGDTVANILNDYKVVGVSLTDAAGVQSNPDGITIYLPSSVSATGRVVGDFLVNDEGTGAYVPAILESDLIAGPVTVDGAVDLDGFEADSFAGGSIFINATQARVDLSVRDDGTGARQIGFDGTNVTYGGVLIGTVDATHNGVDGARLQINLLAAANSEAVEALAEAFTMALGDQGGAASGAFTFQLRVTNGSAQYAESYMVQPVTLDVSTPVAGGAPQWANTAQTGAQDTGVTVELDDGGYMVFWASPYQDIETSGDDGVFGQRFNAQGAKIGAEFQVNDITYGHQSPNDAARLADGRIAALWQDNGGADGSGQGLYATILNADGTATGPSVAINDVTSSNQNQGAIAALSDGRFAVVYTSAATGSDVLLRIFNSDGSPAGASLTVPTSAVYQGQPSVAELPDGDLMVTWEDQGGTDGSGYGIFAQRVDAAGAGALVSFDGTTAGAAETLIPVDPSGYQYEPYVSALAPSAFLPGGGFAIAWTDATSNAGEEGMIRFYALDGTPVSGDIALAAGRTGVDHVADLVSTPDGGVWVAWYSSSDFPGASGYEVYAREMGPDGSFIGPIVRLNAENGDYPTQLSVALLTGGGLAAAWNGSDSNGNSVNTAIWDAAVPGAGAVAPALAADFGGTYAENAVNAAPQLLVADALVGLVDADSADFDGGTLHLWRQSVVDVPGAEDFGGGDGPEQDNITLLDGEGVTLSGGEVRVDGVLVGTLTSDGAGGADFIVTFTAAAGAPEVERVIARLAYANGSDDPIATRQYVVQVTDGDGGATAPVAFDIAVTAEDDLALSAGTERSATIFEPGVASTPEMSAIYDGAGAQTGWVSVWRSTVQDLGPESTNGGVYAQVYGLDGTPVGLPFNPTDWRSDDQYQPHVAGLTGGGYVIVWADNSARAPAGFAAGETSSAGVYAQVFDVNHQPVGGQFLVNDVTNGGQYQPVVTALDDGGFLVGWGDDSGRDGSGWGVFARAFDADGTARGVGVQVNAATSSTQYVPEFSTLADGRIAAVWTSYDSQPGGDGSDAGIMTAILNADGSVAVAETLVNTVIANTQVDPQVAALTGGGYVVAWSDYSNGLDGSGYSIRMQRYDASGAPVEGERLVNTAYTGAQYQPDLVGLEGGGWVVVWTDDRADGNGDGVFAQVYDALGARVDGAFQVNDASDGAQNQPVVAALPGGGFAVTYLGRDGSNANVMTRSFDASGAAPGGGDPSLGATPASVAVDEAAANAAPQLIFAGMFADDADSADFDGGVLTVGIVEAADNRPDAPAQDAAGQDMFSVTETGSVTRSGASVLVNGVVVGTVSGEAGGVDLAVTFNAAADAAAVQAVLRAVGYSNLSDAPNPTRLAAVQLTDGDGGATRVSVTIEIAAETDGLFAVRDEAQVNAFAEGNQSESAVAVTADGGYVIAWRSQNQDATGDNDWGVFAQRYDASGAATGPEFQVNVSAAGAQSYPDVVGLAGGGFVIAYTDNSNVYDTRATVVLQRYDASGVAQGAPQSVQSPGDVTSSGPLLAATPSGGYVLMVSGYDYTEGEYEVRTEVYDAAGALLSANDVVSGSNSSLYGTGIDVAADGTMAAAWQVTSAEATGGTSYGVFLQLLDATGAPVGLPQQVNQYERGEQSNIDVIALQGGGWAAIWSSYDQEQTDGNYAYGVYARMYDAAGAALGDEFLVHTGVSSSQYQPRAAAVDGGGFIVAMTDGAIDGSNTGVALAQVDADGTLADDPALVNQTVVGLQTAPDLAVLPDGRVVISWTDEGGADGSGAGVFTRTFGDATTPAAALSPVVDGVNAEVTFAENDVNGVPQLIDADGAAAVSHPGVDDFGGGSILLTSVISSAPLIDQIPSPDDLTQDELGLRQTARISISGASVLVDGVQVATIVQDGRQTRPLELALEPGTDAETVELLIENLTYRNLSDDPLESRRLRLAVTDGQGGASEPVYIDVTVAPGPDGAVPVDDLERDATAGGGFATAQNHIATLPGTDGDFIVVWRSNGQDGDGHGIYAQRFDSFGNKLARDGTALASGQSDEFLVNVTTAGAQQEPHVTGLSDGGFLVTYRSYSGAPTYEDVMAVRYDASGALVELDGSALVGTGETSVAAVASGWQYEPEAVELTGGQIVFTWYSDATVGAGDGNSYGVVQRIYTPGSGFGAQTVVNTNTTGSQALPSVAALDDGGYVVAWQSSTGDGSGDGVFAQRFDAAGALVGTEFLVNARTDNAQNDVHVATLESGNLVFTWTDYAGDLSGYGVYARLFAPDGTALSQEFRVNDERASTQWEPDVVALDSGGFVIAWSAWAPSGGESYDVVIQQYGADGARLDSQQIVNTTVTGNQTAPSLAALPGGGFAVSWDGSVGVRVFGNQAPGVDTAYFGGDEDTVFTLGLAAFDDAFTDPDGQQLAAIRIVTLPSGTLQFQGGPVFAGQEITRAQLLAGDLTYLGQPDAFGLDSFEWQASDGLAFSSGFATAQITLAPINDAPGLDAGPDASPVEGQGFTRTLTLTDPDGDVASFSIDWGDGSAPTTFNSSSLSPQISHAYAAEGVYTVTVTVDDNAGEANSVESDSFQVTVLNADPVARNDWFTAQEDGPALSGDVTANNGAGADSDPGGDTLSVASVNGSAAAIGSTITLASGALLTMNADGSFSYDANGAFESTRQGVSATDSFTYELSDGDGGTDTANVTVFVQGANDAPVAGDDAFTVNSNSTVSGDVTVGAGADTDVDDLAVLTVTAVNGSAVVGTQVTLPSGALLTMQADGTFVYDPNGASGTDSFTYTIEDEHGAADIATVDININSVNQDPTAEDDAVSTGETSVASGSVLADNGAGADSDPNGDPLTVTRVNGTVFTGATSITLASGAVVTMNDAGDFTYTPYAAANALAAGESATDSFTYTIEDGAGGADTATVTVTLVGENDDPVAVNDSASTSEDATVSGNVLTGAGADGDPDGTDTLFVSAVAGAAGSVGASAFTGSGGTVVIQANGDFTYDPGAVFQYLRQGQTAVDNVEYTVSDGNGGFDTATLAITVIGVNDDPTAADDAFGVTETGTLTGNLMADNGAGADGDVDQNDDPVVVAVNGLAGNVGAAFALPSGALLTVSASGALIYDPNGAFAGLASGATATDSFTYTIEDEFGAQATATATVTITGQDSPPTAGDDSGLTTTEGAVLAAIDVLANDTDAETATADLVVSAIEGTPVAAGGSVLLASGARVTLNLDGTLDYDPNGAFESLGSGASTVESFTYTVEDEDGQTDEGTVSVTVTGLNDDPVARNDFRSTDEQVAISGDVLADNGAGADSDVDAGDTLSVTEVNGAAGNVGAAVVLAGGGLLTINSDGSFDFDPNGAYEYLAQGESVVRTATYTVSDGNGGTDTATLFLTVAGVNDQPIAQDDDISAAPSGVQTGSVLADNGNGADSDPDATDILAVSAVNGAPGLVGVQQTLASGALLTINSDGSYSFDPNGAYDSLPSGATATETVDYTISDGNGGFDTATATFTISGDNLPPAARDDALTTDEETAAAFDLLADNGGGADEDPNGDALTVTAVNGGADPLGAAFALASGALLTVNGDGSVAFDPNGAYESLGVGQSAQEVFTYTLSDGNGGFDTATTTITITGVNDQPAAADDALSVGEDAVISVQLITGDNGAGPDVDIDGDTLTVIAVNGSAARVGVDLAAYAGIQIVQSDGTLTFDARGAWDQLDLGDTAVVSFGYRVSDGHGGEDSATVTVTVVGANDGPTAEDDAFATDADAAVSGDVLADNGAGADSDADASAVLSVAEVNGAAAGVGVPVLLASGALLTLLADGTFDYDPNGAFDGLVRGATATDSFAYTLTDEHGAEDSADVTVTVTGVNHDPVANADTISVSEDAAGIGNLRTNDTDYDGDALTVTAMSEGALATPILLPSGGILTVYANGHVDYDPNGAWESLGAGQTGFETFTYTVSDGNGGTATGTATIEIAGVNDDPVAVADVISVSEDGVGFGNLRNNDTDVDGGPLTVAGISAGALATPILLPSGGILTVYANGHVDYDSNGAWESLGAGQTGFETFTYTVSDGNGGSATGTATIEIAGVNDDPVAGDDAASTAANTAVDVDVLGNDADVDGGALSVSAITVDPANGTAVILPSGEIRYTPDTGFSGTDTLTYEVSDGNGGTDTAVLTITVAAGNIDPAAADDAASVVEGGTVSIAVLANDADADGDPLTVASASDPANGSVTVLASGEIEYTADPGFVGTDSFTYVVEDGEGGSDTATVVVTVEEAPSTIEIGVGLVAPGGAGFAPAPTSSADEGDPGDSTEVWFTLTRTGSLTLATTATVMVTAGGLTLPQSVSFAAGQAQASFSRTVAGDFALQGDRAISAEVTATDRPIVDIGAQAVAAHTIIDDDFGGVIDLAFDGQGASPAEVAEGDAGQTLVSFTATRSGDLDGPVTVTLGAFGTAGATDVSGAPTTITFADGQSTATGTVAILGDYADEADESFTLTVLSTDRDGIVGGDDAELVILDDDALPLTADDAFTGPSRTPTVIDLLANDADPDGRPMSVAVVDGQAIAPGGAVILASGAAIRMAADGSVEYDPNGAWDRLAPGAEATDSFTYRASDGTDLSAEATVTFTIAPVLVTGGDGSDENHGGDDNDVVNPGGGTDLAGGGGGGDLFDFGDLAGNGARDFVQVLDYTVDEDAIALGDGVGVLHSFVLGGDLTLFTDAGEFDTIVVRGVDDIALIDFI